MYTTDRDRKADASSISQGSNSPACGILMDTVCVPPAQQAGKPFLIQIQTVFSLDQVRLLTGAD